MAAFQTFSEEDGVSCTLTCLVWSSSIFRKSVGDFVPKTASM